MRHRLLTALGAVLALSAVPAGPAAAAPPSNDDRASARAFGALPTRFTGTTEEATLEPTEPGSSCSGSNNSVWYSLSIPEDARYVVAMQADGDLDAVVDVFRRQRSQLRGVDCGVTDRRGRAQLAFRAKKGEVYLVRVAQLFNSVAGTFAIEAGEAIPEARPPGRSLPRSGGRDTVDRILNPSDAWSAVLASGVTYRVNLAELPRAGDDDEDRGGCVSVTIFRPGTTDFDSGSVLRRIRCGGYFAWTPRPGRGGRYSFRVHADSGRGALPYRLTVARTGTDDTAPGRFVRNYQRMRGSLSGSRIDVVDLYRFDVARRSDLTLRMAPRGDADFDLVLLDDRGRRLETANGEGDEAEIVRRSRPGRYFAAVRARGGSGGTYSFVRITRAITRSRITINGRRGSLARPGTTVPIAVDVTPAVAGPVTVFVQRFDPLFGWQFAYRYRRRISAGRAVIPFQPPTVGRWRARAEFEGTRTASPSRTRYARLLVAGPLEE